MSSTNTQKMPMNSDDFEGQQVTFCPWKTQGDPAVVQGFFENATYEKRHTLTSGPSLLPTCQLLVHLDRASPKAG